MNKLIFTLFSIALLSTIAPQAVSASSGGAQACQPIYGGGESCVQAGEITINKFVQNPQTKVYVENLGINDSKLLPGQTVNFKLTVKNTSNAKLNSIVIKDILPEFVEFVQAPGNFDKNSKTLTLKLDTLGPNESRDFFVVGKIADISRLPADQDIICLVNQATVSMDSKVSQDNAQFCLEKVAPAPKNPEVTKGGLKVFPPTQVEKTPETGPEMLALVGLLPAGGLGMFLRRKNK